MNPSNVLIEGYVTKNCNIEYNKTGKLVLMFSMAIEHYSRPGEPPKVSFIEIEAWDKMAEENKEYAKKGVRLQVSGRLRQDRWTDDNGICSRIKIYAEEIKVTL